MIKKVNVADYIYDLLEKYGVKGLKKHTDDISCQCPFHANRSNFKTFRVSTVEKKWRYEDDDGKAGVATGYFFNCFSCHEHGNIYKLIAHLSRCSYSKAIRLFKKRVVLDPITMDMLNKELDLLRIEEESEELGEIALPPIAENERPMYAYMESRSKKYHGILDVDYIVRKYGLYYCSTGREAGRIIMPIYNSQNMPICFNDRTVNEGIREKSLHVGGLPYGKVLFGWNYRSQKKHCIIVEGAFDKFQVECALFKHEHYRQRFDVLALQGTAFTDYQATMVVGKYDSVILMLDNDKAGLLATKKIWEKIKDELPVLMATDKYPEGKDPGKCTCNEVIRAIRCADKPRWRSYLEYMIKKHEFRV